jgi:hypothetical protein
MLRGLSMGLILHIQQLTHLARVAPNRHYSPVQEWG